MAKANTLRQQKQDLMRDEIQRAAAELFAERGYRAVTIDDIVERIGFTKSAMYYYYKNKYHLLSKIFHDSISHYLSNAQRIAASIKDPKRRLRDLIRQHVINVLELRHWTTVYFREESELDEKDRAFMRKHKREYSELFAKAYSEGVRAGLFKDVEALMVVDGVIGAANSIVMWHHADPKRSPSDLADAVADLVAGGYER